MVYYFELLKNIFEQNQWLKALVIVLVFLLVAKIITWLSEKVFKKWAGKTETQLDDLIIAKIRAPFSYVIVLAGLKFALREVALNYSWLDGILNTIVIMTVVYITFAILDILITVWGKEFAHKTKSKLDDSLLPIAQRLIKVIFAVIGLIWMLKEWSFDVGPFLASLGIAGFAVGFALQGTLKDVFGGVSLILDKSFRVGDKVELDGGILGVVHDISIRSTKVKTYDNEVITIPNGKLSEANIKNFVQPNSATRVVINFTVAYGSDIEKVKKVVGEAVEKNVQDISKDPYYGAIMTDMGDSALKFQMRFWTDYDLAYDKKIEGLQVIYEALNKIGIEIPFPQIDINLKK